MQYFTWAVIWTVVACAVLMTLAWMVDPFVYFRKPGFFAHTYSSSNSRHMMPGMLRHFEYDSVVAGNSQAQNFTLAELRDVLGWEAPFKATSPASYPAALRRFLEIAFEHRELKNVFVGMTITSYRAPPDHIDRVLEPYLYEPSWTTVHKYLMNYDVVLDRMPKNLLLTFGIGAPRARRRSNPENMFNLDYSAENRTFNATKVQSAFIRRGANMTAVERVKPGERYDAERFMEVLRRNSLDLIDAHPETTFYMVLMPLPHLEWYKMRTEGCIDAMLAFMEAAAIELTSRDNVQFYDFVTVPDIVMDLDNFRDLAHFKPEVSHAMLQHISKKEHRITPDTIAPMLERMRWMSLSNNVPGWAVEPPLRQADSTYSDTAPVFD